MTCTRESPLLARTCPRPLSFPLQVDRFLDRNVVKRTEVQLLGVAALLVASKAEESRYPDLGELLYLCDGIYTRPQVIVFLFYLSSSLSVCLSVSWFSSSLDTSPSYLLTPSLSFHPCSLLCALSSFLLCV